ATTDERRGLRRDVVDTDVVSSGVELSERDSLSVSIGQAIDTIAREDVFCVGSEIEVPDRRRTFEIVVCVGRDIARDAGTRLVPTCCLDRNGSTRQHRYGRGRFRLLLL